MRVIVIGGGIVGSSAAYALQRAGADTVLIDREDAGQATAAGAGIVAPGSSLSAPAAWYPLAYRAVAFYEELLQRLSEDGEAATGYEVVGELFVATNESEETELERVLQVVEERKRGGVRNIGDVAVLTPQQAQSLFPALRDGVPALHLSGAARVDGRLIRDAMRQAMLKHGGTIQHGDATIVWEGNRVTGVRVAGEEIKADGIVLAAGAWSRQAAAAVDIDLEVFPQRGQIVHLEVPGAMAGKWPIITGFHSHYMLTFPPSRIVVGATRESGSGFDYRVTAGGEYEVLHEALRVAPGLSGGTLRETRVGFRPVTSDGLAVLGAAPNVEGLWIATGLGPTGLTIGPYAGSVAAGLALGVHPDIDLSPYDPGRFSGSA